MRDSLALRDLPEPAKPNGECSSRRSRSGCAGLKCRTWRGSTGQAPPGSELLVSAHENLGRVTDAGGSDFSPAKDGDA
jgi:hypothetical protein